MVAERGSDDAVLQDPHLSARAEPGGWRQTSLHPTTRAFDFQAFGEARPPPPPQPSRARPRTSGLGPAASY
eukprot:12869629-Alexandrium_andersonii.AAC.1